MKERGNDTKNYVQKDAEDFKTKLSEVQREHDRLMWSMTEETKKVEEVRAKDS